MLPPVLMELRADAGQAVREFERAGLSARTMADQAVAASSREAEAAKSAATASRAAADQKVAAADAASKAQQEAAAKTAAAVRAAQDEERASIASVNKAMAEGSITAKEAAAEKVAAADKAAAAIKAAEVKEAEAAKASAAAQKEAAASVKAAQEAETKAYAASGAASDAMMAKHKANAKSIVDASNVISGAAIAAAGIIGVAAIEEASKFQKATELLVTAGGESQKDLGAVRTGILGIAADTGTATDQLAEGMYVMEKAGYHGADGLKVLRAAAEGAKAENVDLQVMTQAVTDVLLDYGKGADQAVSVTNGLVAASGLAKTTMQDFASSMAAIVPTASVAHLSFAQVGGALATMTQHGESAQQSSQNLANLLTQLERPSNIASKAMQQMGIDVTDLSKNIGDENGGRGLLGTLQLMDKHIKDHMGADGTIVQSTMQKSASAAQDLHKIIAQMPPELAKLSQGFLEGSVTQKDYMKGYKDFGGSASVLGSQFMGLAKQTLGVNDLIKAGNPALMTYVGMWNRAAGGITGARTAMMLLMNNAAEFQNNIDRITEAEDKNGTHIQTWAQTQSTFSTQLDMTKQSVSNLGIELGTKLLPAAQNVLHSTEDLIHGFEQGNPVLMTAATIIGGALLISTVNLGIKMGSTAVGVIKNAIEMGKSAKDMASQFHIGFSTVGTDAELGASKMERFGGAVNKALPALGRLSAGAGVAGVALAGLKAIDDQFGTHGSAASIEQTTNAILGLGKATETTDSLFTKWDNGVLSRGPSDVHNLSDAVGYLNDGWAQAGDAMGGWFSHLLGVKDGMDQVKGVFDTYGQSLANMSKSDLPSAATGFDQVAEAFVKQHKTAQDALDTMPAYRDALLQQAQAAGVSLSQQELLEFAMGKVPQKMQDATQSTGDYIDKAGQIKPITPALKKSLDEAGVSAEGLVTDLDKVRSGMEADGLATINARDAQSRMNQSMDDAKKAMDEVVQQQKEAAAQGKVLGNALNKQKTDFDLTTEAGRTLNDKYEAVMKSGEDLANSVKGTGVDAQKQVQDALTQTYDNLVTAGNQMGITGDHAVDLARHVMGIPPGVDIHTWMDDYAKNKADATAAAVDAINPHKVVVVDIQVNNQGGLDPGQYANAEAKAQASGQRVAFASGGLVGGYPRGGLLRGPGSGTSDSMVARVSNGEYIVRAAAVQRVGVGFLDSLNSGALHPAPGSPAMAHSGGGGGNVTVYATTNASPQMIASEVGWALRNQN